MIAERQYFFNKSFSVIWGFLQLSYCSFFEASALKEVRVLHYLHLSTFPASIRLGEGVLKTSSSTPPSKNIFKTSSRRLDQDEIIRRRLQDFFKTSLTHTTVDWLVLLTEDKLVFKTSSCLVKTSTTSFQEVLRRRIYTESFKTVF